MPKLSVCVPTYNRSEYLAECLESIISSAKGFEDRVEIVVSDNASEDDTPAVMAKFCKAHPWIRYHRNDENIGGERNFRRAVELATADHIWIFCDDDKMTPEAIPSVLSRIEAGCDLIVCNYSVWSKDFSVMKKPWRFRPSETAHFDDPNDLLKSFGVHLGYLPLTISRRSRFLALPVAEYERFVCYGFPHMYALYYGMYPDGRSVYIPEPLFCNRVDNWGNFDWYKVFVIGSSLIFENLRARGYSADAARLAKRGVIRDFVIRDLLVRKRDGASTRGLFGIMYPHYKKEPLFWIGCIPALLAPRSLVRMLDRLVFMPRREGLCKEVSS